MSAVGKAVVFVALACVLGMVFLPKPPLWEGLSFSQAVFDRDGRLLRLTLSPDDKYRLRVPLAQMSPTLVQATLLLEDRAFRSHPGVHPVALFKALWRTYVKRTRRMGGSTLTMQLARIRFRIDSSTPLGKLKQIARALQIERYHTKDEILEAYLNLVPYGGNLEGVGAASLVYFHKQPDKLTLSEAIALSVIPQNPNHRAPLGKSQLPPALVSSHQRLLETWQRNHPSEPMGAEALALPAFHQPKEMPFLAPHFVGEVIRSHPGRSVVMTRLDLRLQKLLERHLHTYIERTRERGIRNGSAMLVDWRTMEVLASVGSADFWDPSIQGQVNGTRAKRSPGSALKPFIYALGFEQGIIHPLSMLKDAPLSFGGYNPENFDGDFLGPIAASDALARSRNVPAVFVASQLSQPTFYEFLQRAQISGLRPESDYGLALVLGSAETSMEELMGLYAMLPFGGVWRPLEKELTDSHPMAMRLLSEEGAFLALDALTKHGRPNQAFNNVWTADSVKVAWKTGTSHRFKDAWCFGIFGPYVLGVWMGNFEGQSNPALVGVEAAAPLLFELVDSIRAERRSAERVLFTSPPTLRHVEVCAVSGQLPGPHCKRKQSTWFIPGRSPIRICDVHREVLVDTRTGQSVCAPGPFARAEVYEFWPSDLLRIFTLAGIPRRLPPPASETCTLDVRASTGQPPKISSPGKGVAYNVQLAQADTQKIPLTAVTDGGTRSVYWFLDEKFLGKASAQDSFLWEPKPGEFVVRVVDDHGRSDSRDFKVRLVQ